MKKIVLILSLLGLTSGTYSMSPQLIHYAKSALQVGSGIALWALPAKWGFADELRDGNENRHNAVKLADQAESPSGPVINFVHASVKRSNLTVDSIEKINITMNPTEPEFSINDNGDLNIPYDNTTFETFITENNKDKLADAQAAITHEISHFLHKDEFVKEIFANPGIILGVSTAALVLQKFMWPAPIDPNIAFSVGRACAAVPVYLLAKRCRSLYSQHCEWRADENIPQERALLESQISYYKKEQEKEKKLMQHKKSIAIEKLKSGKIVGGLKDLWYSYTSIQHDWFFSHPHPTKRLARFEERLAELEKTE